MSRIRSKDTKPELMVRRLIHSMGYRFRLHRRNLPGRPDIVFPGRQKVVFVHGCFWHRHPNCARAQIPDANRDYWEPKLARNVQRDREALEQLANLGWRSFVVWECEVQPLDALAKQISWETEVWLADDPDHMIHFDGKKFLGPYK